MLPAEEFERLTGRAKKPQSLAKFFAESPLAKVTIDLERTPATAECLTCEWIPARRQCYFRAREAQA
jgi:hypothetical protein